MPNRVEWLIDEIDRRLETGEDIEELAMELHFWSTCFEFKRAGQENPASSVEDRAYIQAEKWLSEEVERRSEAGEDYAEINFWLRNLYLLFDREDAMLRLKRKEDKYERRLEEFNRKLSVGEESVERALEFARFVGFVTGLKFHFDGQKVVLVRITPS